MNVQTSGTLTSFVDQGRLFKGQTSKWNLKDVWR